MYIFYPEAKTDFHKNKVKIKSYKNLKVNENGKKSNSLALTLSWDRNYIKLTLHSIPTKDKN